MAKLELIWAPTGAGKTHLCLEEFKNALLASNSGLTNTSWFVLPTYEHAERINDLLLKDKRLQGFFKLHVTTINAFVEKEVAGLSAPLASDLVKLSLISQILKNGSWRYFESLKQEASLAELVSQFFSELKTTCPRIL